MGMTVREFLSQSFQLINASNPTIPMHGNDELLSLKVLNQILASYSSNSLMITIAKTVSTDISPPVKELIFTDSGYLTSSEKDEVVNLISGSPSFIVNNSDLYFIGDIVNGNGVPLNSIIVSIVGNLITLNNDLTFNGQSRLTFYHDYSSVTESYIKKGRLSNLNSAWIELEGVTYPLCQINRDDFLQSYKYEPMTGLPVYIITYPEVSLVRAQIYPAPSQSYRFFARGKFQLSTLTINDSVDNIPDYMQLFLMYALARNVCKFKGRSAAWTEDMEMIYRELKQNMESASEVNLSITGNNESMLNGAYRVKAGI